MCIAHKKHVKHAHVEPEKSLSVLERQSQTIFSLFPSQKSNQSSNRFVKNKPSPPSLDVQKIDFIEKQSSRRHVPTIYICVIIRLFRRTRTARTGRRSVFFPQDFSLGLLHLPHRGGYWLPAGLVQSRFEAGPEIGSKRPYHGGNAREAVGFELALELEMSSKSSSSEVEMEFQLEFL